MILGNKKPAKISSHKSSKTEEQREILSELSRIHDEMVKNRQKFNMATEEALIDSYIYEMAALDKRYKYYLELAKKQGITAEGFKKISW